jgi:hypothetical protein
MRTESPTTWQDISFTIFLICAAVAVIVLAGVGVRESLREPECSRVIMFRCAGELCRVETEAGWRTTTGPVLEDDVVCRRAGDE